MSDLPPVETPLKAVKAKKKGGLGKFFARLFYSLVGIPLLLAAGLFIWYLSTIRDPRVYLSQEFSAYVEIPSLRKIYEDLIDLKVSELVLAERDLAPVRKALTEFKSQAISQDPVVRMLMDVSVHFMVLENGAPFLAFDLGPRSALTRLVPLLSNFVNFPGFSVIQKEGKQYLSYQTSETSQVYLHMVDNLVLLSTELAPLEGSLRLFEQKKSLAQKLDISWDGHDLGASSIRFLVDTQKMISGPLSQDEGGRALLSRLSFPQSTAASAVINNERIDLRVSLFPQSTQPLFSALFERTPEYTRIFESLPEQTVFLGLWNGGTFQSLLDILGDLHGQSFQSKIQDMDNGARTVLGLGLEELLFRWAGAEAGVFQLAQSRDPGFFLRVKDQGALKKMLDVLTSSLFLGEDRTLSSEGQSIPRLKLPWYLSGIMELVGIKIPEPFYLMDGDYIFFSLDARVLAQIPVSKREGTLWKNTAAYRKLMEHIPLNPIVLSYFDAQSSTPFFLKGRDLTSRILKMYNQGTFGLFKTSLGWMLQFTALSEQKELPLDFPGYPYKSEQRITSEVLAVAFEGQSYPKLVYVEGDQTLVILDPLSLDKKTLTTNSRILLFPAPVGKTSNYRFLTLKGDLVTVNGDGAALTQISMGSILSGVTGVFSWHDGRPAVFSRSQKRLIILNPDATYELWPYEFEDFLTNPVVFQGSTAAFHPMSVDSGVYVTDLRGQNLPGWPVFGTGLSLGTPVIIPGAALRVALLAQNGQLFLWEKNGQPVKGFPLNLGGVFSSTPVYRPGTTLADSFLVSLADNGMIHAVNLLGEVQTLGQLDGLSAKDTKIVMRDMNGDGAQDFVFYGGGQYLLVYDAAFRPLAPYPLKGSSRPVVADLNNDGRYEVTSSGLDHQIHSYTVPGVKP